MKFVYVDTSVFVAVMFKEPSGQIFRKALKEANDVVSSSLLEAELFAVAKREKVDFDVVERSLKHVSLVFPDRSLKQEFHRLFKKGYCRGADAHHLATALYLDSEAANLRFLTADSRQAQVASSLGFQVE